jgi:hypothetical protein
LSADLMVIIATKSPVTFSCLKYENAIEGRWRQLCKLFLVFSYRSHAMVTLRKEPWIPSSRLSEIVSVIYRELRDPKPGISLPISCDRSWRKD